MHTCAQVMLGFVWFSPVTDFKGRPRLRPRDATRSAPLSIAQERLWFLEQLDGRSTAYNMPELVQVHGVIDVTLFERAVQDVVDRHDALRTYVMNTEGPPVQGVAPAVTVELPVHDLRRRPRAEQEQILAQAIRDEWTRAFDLRRAPLFRMCLYALSDQHHAWVRTFHHFIFDGWSQRLLNREVVLLYDARRAIRPSPLVPLIVQYGDFAEWQRGWMATGGADADVSFWKRELAGAPESLNLATDHVRPPMQTHDAETVRASVPGELLERMRRFASKENLTLYAITLAAFAAVIERHTGLLDFLIGFPVAGRQHALLEAQLGLFVNALPARLLIDRRSTVRQFFESVRRTLLAAYEHQEVPFDRLVQELGPARTLGTTPLFQVLFASQTVSSVASADGSLTLEPVICDASKTRFELEVHVVDRPGSVELLWVYNRDLYDRRRIELMARQHLTMLDAAVSQPDTRISEVEILSADERVAVLDTFSAPARGELTSELLHSKFEAHAAVAPNRVAIRNQQASLTYSELDRRANQIAHHLLQRGIRLEDAVCVALPRSVDMIVAVLAILKVGAAYVPLDLALPNARLHSMVRQLHAARVLTNRGSVGQLLVDECEVWCIEDLVADSLDAPTSRPPVSLHGENLTSVLFTSGSTGHPKGVALRHRSGAALVDWGCRVMPAEAFAAVAFSTSLSFDLSVFELFVPLSIGGTVVLVDNVLALADPGAGRDVTLINTVPSAMTELLRLGGVRESVSVVCLAGEALPEKLVEEVAQHAPTAKIYNLYGPTESTTYSTYALVEPGPRVTIGSPIPNTQAFVLDRWLRPSPVGALGELYLAGEGLARGYAGAPALTSTRFLASAYGAAGTRMYRTGDIVQWRCDGQLEFHGRDDLQVKVRGFRIELTEIDTAVRQHAAISECATVASHTPAGFTRIITYWTQASAAADAGVSSTELRRHVKRLLPSYMVPDVFVQVEALPRTSTGKVDRAVLPAVKLAPSVPNTPSQTPREDIISDIFCDVLGLEQLGREENFFDVGGHSLLATRLVSRIRDALAIDVPLRTIFENPTVTQLVAALSTASGGRARLTVTRPRPLTLPLSYPQQRLWFLHQLQGATVEYNMPEAFRLVGPLDLGAFETAVDTIVARHEVLRTAFVESSGVAAQSILESLRAPLLVMEDLRQLTTNAVQNRIRTAQREEAGYRFDLAKPPLLRLRLLRTGDREHILLRTMHHIVSDAWSQGVFNRELSASYDVGAQMAAVPPLNVQYADFALWQRAWADTVNFGEGLTYWKQQLAGAPGNLQLPRDKSRAGQAAFNADGVLTTITADQLRILRRVSRANDATLFMTTLAMFGIILARYTGQDDLVIGSPIANRQDAQLESLIGFFANTLALRLRVNDRETFRNLLTQVRRTSLEAYEHQDVPFERVVEALAPARADNVMPLVQATFALQNVSSLPLSLRGMTVEALDPPPSTVRFDLEVYAIERMERLDVYWLYNTAIFERARIEQMASDYVNGLMAVAIVMDRPMAALDFSQSTADQSNPRPA